MQYERLGMKLRQATLQQLRRPLLTQRLSRNTSFSGSAQASLRSASQPRRHYASISAAELQFGQPVHETHPHLLRAGELTPGISSLEYHQRRSKLAASLPENGIAILAASDTKYRSGAVFYEFHQESNFFYLTGFNEPEATAIIQKIGGAESAEYVFHLFLRPKDEKAELWDGARSGKQAALDVFNADEVCSSNHLKISRY